MKSNVGLGAFGAAFLTLLPLTLGGCLGGFATYALLSPPVKSTSLQEVSPGITKMEGIKPLMKKFWDSADRTIIILDRNKAHVIEVPSDQFASAPGRVLRQFLPFPFIAHDIATSKGSAIETAYRNKANESLNKFNLQLDNLFNKSTGKISLILSSLPSSPSMVSKKSGDSTLIFTLLPTFIETEKANSFIMNISLGWIADSDYDKLIMYYDKLKNTKNVFERKNVASMYVQFEGYGELKYRSKVYPAEEWLANDGNLMTQEINRAMEMLLEALRQEFFPSKRPEANLSGPVRRPEPAPRPPG